MAEQRYLRRKRRPSCGTSDGSVHAPAARQEFVPIKVPEKVLIARGLCAAGDADW